MMWKTQKKPLVLLMLLFLLGMFIFVFLEKKSNVYSFDMEDKRLNVESLALLGSLDKTLRIEVYASEQSAVTKNIVSFVKRFQNESQWIDLKIINPEKNPSLVRQNSITMSGEMLFNYDDKSVHVTELSEESFMNAILSLQNESEKWIVLAEGFGMQSVEDKTENGLIELLIHLKKLGYKVARMKLASDLVLPDQVKVIVLPRPIEPLEEPIANWISQQSASGKNIFWLTDTEAIGQQFHLEILFDVIITEKAMLNESEQSGIVAPVVTHEVSKNFNQPVYLAESYIVDSNQGKAFLKTETNMSIGLNKNINGARVVIMGDSDWLSNQYFHTASNKNLAVRIFDYLLEKDNRFNLALEVNKNTELHFTTYELVIYSILSLIIVPLFFLIVAFTIWRRQRFG